MKCGKEEGGKMRCGEGREGRAGKERREKKRKRHEDARGNGKITGEEGEEREARAEERNSEP